MEREKGEGLSHPWAITARFQSPPRSACGLSSEGEEVAFCWAVEVAVAAAGEEEMWVSPTNPGFPSDSHNLPCCL